MKTVNLNPFAKAIAAANARLEKSAAQVAAQVTMNCQAAVDALIVACDQADRAKFWKEQSETIDGFVKSAWPHDSQESARRNYKTSLKIAFCFNIPFAPSLFKDYSAKDGTAKTAKESKGDTAKTAGKVTSTTREELDKTLQKALHQMRLLKLHGLASDVLDVLQGTLSDFQEKAE